MAKQYIVIRGQIEKRTEAGSAVVAKRGQPYKPKNDAEEKRLVAAGIIALASGSEPEDKPALQGQGGE
jgi:hypothetical protein